MGFVLYVEWIEGPPSLNHAYFGLVGILYIPNTFSYHKRWVQLGDHSTWVSCLVILGM